MVYISCSFVSNSSSEITISKNKEKVPLNPGKYWNPTKKLYYPWALVVIRDISSTKMTKHYLYSPSSEQMTHPLCTGLMPKNNHSHKHVHLNGEKSLVFSLLRSQSGCKESRFYGLPFGQVFDEQHWLQFFCNLNFPINFTCPLGK